MTISNKTISILLLCLIFLTSCGVMFGGTQYSGTITVQDHPNADIYIDGSKVGKGITTGTFKRKNSLIVEIKEEGCADKTQTFEKTLRTGNFIISILSWGLIGLGVDLGTGAAYKPNHGKDDRIQKVNDKQFNFTASYSCD